MPTDDTRAERFRWVIVAAAAAVGLLHVLGALQVREQVYRGYRSVDDGVIVSVAPGGPADRAGLRVGDRVLRIDGIDASDTTALAARPPARPGQSQSILVGRGGSSLEVRLILAGLPPMGVVAYLASALTGLSFLAFGLWAYLQAPRRTSRLLALAGIGLGALFTEQPYVASRFASALQESSLIAAGVFGFAALLHFTLVFPEEQPILGRRFTLPALYAPPGLVAAGHMGATILQRGEPGSGVALATTAAIVLVLTDFLLAVAVLVRSVVRATPFERAASGLNVLVGCLVLGLAPMIPTAVYLVAPGVVFPGSDYYDLTWVLIPFALARATVLQSRREPAGTAGQPSVRAGFTMDIRRQMDRIYSEFSPDEIPWHMATPPPALVDLVESGRVTPCRAVDLGCGAGNHAVWLALQGFDVTGLELSAAAVARAQELARAKGVACRFAIVDLLEPVTAFDGCFEFAYDWLVLHHVFPADRPRYAANVHRMLGHGGLYLSVCFSEDDRGIAGEGKCRQPQLGTQLYLSSEREIRVLFEPLFDVLELATVDVEGTRSPHRAVRTLMRKRA